jgi:hypothetical protein
VLDVPIEHVAKATQKPRASRDERQQIGDTCVRQLAVERAVGGFYGCRIDQFSASLFGPLPDFDPDLPF